MANTSPGYGITIRVEGRAEFQPVAEITTIISREGAMVTALDVVESQIDAVVLAANVARRTLHLEQDAFQRALNLLGVEVWVQLVPPPLLAVSIFSMP